MFGVPQVGVLDPLSGRSAQALLASGLERMDLEMRGLAQVQLGHFRVRLIA